MGDLPADRCVLDPLGEGIKLLPRGQQRAVWPITGEVYTYGTGSEFGSNLGIENSVDSSLLTSCEVDERRPVCSNYLAGKCNLARKCPWRHCQPLPGDSIREPVSRMIDEP